MWHLGFVVPSSPSLQLQSPYCFNYWWHLVAKKNITFDTSSSDCCSLTMTRCSREVPFYDKSKSKLINIKKKGTFILFLCSPFGPCMDSEILPAPSWIRPSKRFYQFMNPCKVLLYSAAGTSMMVAADLWTLANLIWCNQIQRSGGLI